MFTSVKVLVSVDAASNHPLTVDCDCSCCVVTSRSLDVFFFRDNLKNANKRNFTF